MVLIKLSSLIQLFIFTINPFGYIVRHCKEDNKGEQKRHILCLKNLEFKQSLGISQTYYFHKEEILKIHRKAQELGWKCCRSFVYGQRGVRLEKGEEERESIYWHLRGDIHYLLKVF